MQLTACVGVVYVALWDLGLGELRQENSAVLALAISVSNKIICL